MREPKSNDQQTIQKLWTDALAILNGDDQECKQRLPRDLSEIESYGLNHIGAILSMKAGPNVSSKLVELAHPFLQVMTHPALVDCLSVDTAVGVLYNYISGANGSRAMAFFQTLSENLLKSVVEPSPHSRTHMLSATLVAATSALRTLLQREYRAIFNENLPNLLSFIENVMEVTGIGEDSEECHAARGAIEEMRGMIDRNNCLLNHSDADDPPVAGVSTSTVATTYPRALVVPGNRHDNDDIDITKIQILPTEGEIRSNHPAFLPSTDMDQPHHLDNQIARHLDTQFRLLRHDVFGEVCDAIGHVLLAAENQPDLVKNPQLSMANTAAVAHTYAQLRYISFEQRRGLEVQISFLQPTRLHKKSSAQRRKWWEDSKRLEEGVLVCLVAFDGLKSKILFLTVSKRSTDEKDKHGLTSNSQQATITAKITNRSMSDFEVLTRLSCQNTIGVLLEFPNVLLPTIVPFLENIQDMQRLSRLPFRQWILPDQIPKMAVMPEIPPPLYARRAGFHYGLDAIVKEPWLSMSLSPRGASDRSIVDELETRTNLDRGQCQALFAALTREFALIQGPPGTGKSFLGIKIMQVLLACQSKTELGPIIVV